MIEITEDDLHRRELANALSAAVFLGCFASLLALLLADDGRVFLSFVNWIGG